MREATIIDGKLTCPCGNSDVSQFWLCESIATYRNVIGVNDGVLEFEMDYKEGDFEGNVDLFCKVCNGESALPANVTVDYIDNFELADRDRRELA